MSAAEIFVSSIHLSERCHPSNRSCVSTKFRSNGADSDLRSILLTESRQELSHLESGNTDHSTDVQRCSSRVFPIRRT